ncbi:hypothetical protein Trydic_g16753 [Trypoxylus dichotomus]
MAASASYSKLQAICAYRRPDWNEEVQTELGGALSVLYLPCGLRLGFNIWWWFGGRHSFHLPPFLRSKPIACFMDLTFALSHSLGASVCFRSTFRKLGETQGSPEAFRVNLRCNLQIYKLKFSGS